MSFSLKPILFPRPAATTAVILLILLLWLAAHRFIAREVSGDMPSILPADVYLFLINNDIVANIASLFFTLLNTLLIYVLNNKFAVIRTRTLLPVFIFLLLVSVWYQTHYFVFAHFTLTLFIMSLLVFFNMYRNRNSAEQAFMGTLLIAAGSLILKPLILFVPVCWINFIHYNCFSLRTFLASLFGVLVPWVIFFAVNVLIQPDSMWFALIFEAFTVQPVFFERPVAELIYIGALLLVSIVFITEMFILMRKDLLQTRAKLNIIFLFGLAAMVFAFFLQGQYQMFMPFTAFACAMLFSHPLTLKLSVLNTVLCILFVLINMGYALYNML